MHCGCQRVGLLNGVLVLPVLVLWIGLYQLLIVNRVMAHSHILFLGLIVLGVEVLINIHKFGLLQNIYL